MSWPDRFSDLLGVYLEPKELGVVQVCVRGLIVFFVALAIVRVADKRFLSKMSAFDALLGFVLASALARAINGSAPLLPTLVMGFLLVGLHRLLAHFARRWHWFGVLVKGQEEVLVEDGRINQQAMRANNLSEKDLLEAAREAGQVESLADIQKAVMERSGRISVIPAKNGT